MKKIIILLLFLSFNYSFNIDNPHFYRGSHFFGEPRLKKDNLLSIDIWAGGGSTDHSYNCAGNETSLLNICGNENIKYLGKNVPLEILEKMPNNVLINLWDEKTDCQFGKLKFLGNFKTREIAFNFQQNVCHGFFGQLYIPVRKLAINNITYDDRSLQPGAMKDAEFIKYRHFILELRKNLNAVGINYNKHFNYTGIGDTSFLLGWTFNYEDTKHLDFIDTTFKLGLLFPTGRTTDINNVFDLPQGYNGFFAVPAYFDISTGLFEWLTIGAHAGALFFIDKLKTVRMKSDKEQNGYIKLLKGCARVSQGTIWNLGAFLKADHIFDGFSFTFSYRFDKQERTRLNPVDYKKFIPEIVNTDCLLNGWQMNSLNFIFEYDFATLDCPNRPRINFFFDIPISGKQIFKTTLSGGSIGIDYVW
jgi:hypothetical protein